MKIIIKINLCNNGCHKNGETKKAKHTETGKNSPIFADEISKNAHKNEKLQ
jgi:hypothetical protein